MFINLFSQVEPKSANLNQVRNITRTSHMNTLRAPPIFQRTKLSFILRFFSTFILLPLP